MDGMDLYGNRMPLFPIAGAYGVHGSLHTYALVFWQNLFGYSIDANRAFPVFISFITAGGIYKLTKLISGTKAAIIAIAIDACSPWTFGYSRLAWDHSTSLTISVWSLYFLFRFKSNSGLLAAGAFQALGLYCYASTQCLTIMLFLLSIVFLLFSRKIEAKLLVYFAIPWLCIAMPFFFSLAEGSQTTRFTQVSLFGAILQGRPPGEEVAAWAFQKSGINYHTLPSGDFVLLFIAALSNYISYFSPKLLLWSTDIKGVLKGYPYFGLLNIAEFVGLLALAYSAAYKVTHQRPILLSTRKYDLQIFILLLVLGGIIPGAITWDTFSNPLRALCISPFVHILAAQGIEYLSSHAKKYANIVYFFGVIHACSFFYFYFYLYPALAKELSLHSYKLQALSSTTIASANYKIVSRKYTIPWAYYSLAYFGGSCDQMRSLAREYEEANIRERLASMR